MALPSQLSYNQGDVFNIIRDTESLSDNYLRAEADKALKILDDDDYKLQNNPEWVSRIESLAIPKKVKLKDNYTTFKMFKAMYNSAESCGLPPSAQRYVSVAIYASASKARALSGDENTRRDNLANALERLATTWVAYMLWPFITISASWKIEEIQDMLDVETPTVLDAGSKVPPSGLVMGRCENFRSLVGRRDGYTCCFTGAFDTDAPEDVETLEANDKVVGGTLPMNAVHIFKRAAAIWSEDDENEANTASRRATYDILRHYFHLEGSLEEIIQVMDMPENGIYVNTISHQSFDAFKWCLQPTDIENRYKICIMPSFDRRVMVQPPEGHTHITFADRSGSAADGIALPRKDLLRLHAVLAHVLHLSGAAGLFALLGKDERGGVGGATGISAAPVGVDFMDNIVHGRAWELAELSAFVTDMLAQGPTPGGS